MRIITGEYRGRRLETPVGNDVRPTTDKVKEALFNLIMADVPEAVVVDLFSGSGNLGLEALSRGASRCYFCDSSRDSIALIRRNVEYCRAQERSVIYTADYRKALDKIREKVDVFLLDPPYRKGILPDCLARIEEAGLLAEDGVIVCEHGTDEPMEDVIGGFEKFKERSYGSITLTIYSRTRGDRPE